MGLVLRLHLSDASWSIREKRTSEDSQRKSVY